jgi:hypothetical protein
VGARGFRACGKCKTQGFGKVSSEKSVRANGRKETGWESARMQRNIEECAKGFRGGERAGRMAAERGIGSNYDSITLIIRIAQR